MTTVRRHIVIVGLLTAILNSGADAQSNSAEVRRQLLEQLRTGTFSPQGEKLAIAALARDLAGTEYRSILYAFRKVARRDPQAIDDVMPVFAERIAWAHIDDAHEWEIYLCDLIDALAVIGHFPAEVSAELEALLLQSKECRFAAPKAAGALLRNDPKRRDLLPWIDRQLKSDDDTDRMAMAAALRSRTKLEEPVASRLVELLRDPSPAVQVLAAEALQMRGHPPAEIVTVLQESLRKDPEPIILRPTYLSEEGLDHRHLAVLSLGAMGHEAQPAVNDIADLLGNSDDLFDLFAAEALGKIGVSNRKVLDALVTATKSNNRELSTMAVQSLKELQSANASQ